ncbi:vitamin K epoxide reductase family protein [Flavobacterium sp. SUN046]|uniref:vitamin K epoxide reductase family protein n=1 Tax=Flavobacterium sp. SUN046 TaxID=3002440 RepID=UPI002DBD356E|nr:vitamin K epoxide reductase family protein [Flavobacterium sp. SUN046]MEC4047851.1 vitamin K epoxide reductase family protein [Flavobacterium sp. SUN046]
METPTIYLVGNYLIANGYFDEKNEFENLFLSHPNYPSLFALTDTLDLLGIENVVARVEKDLLMSLPKQFLSFVDKEENLALVQIKEQHVIVELNEKKKAIYTIDSFGDIWNAIVIAVETNEKKAKSDGAPLSKAKPTFNIVVSVILLMAILTLLKYNVNVCIVGFLLITLFGSYISILIVQEKLDIKNEAVSKICRGFNTSCNEVIQSSENDWNQWLSFSDLPLLFFLTNFLALVFQPIAAISIIGFLSTGVLPLLFYSIWLQKSTLKQWCVLCLVVSSLILVQSGFFLFTISSITTENIEDAYYYFLAFLIIASAWFIIRPLLNNQVQAQESINRLLRFKRNFQLFKFLSIPIENASELKELKAIKLGATEANLKLTLLLSPSCGHCHKAFEEAMKLVAKYSQKVSLDILFNLNVDNVDNPYRSIVQHLVAINDKRNNEVYAALSDWHFQRMSIKEWVDKWGDNNITESIDEELRKQYQWSICNKFNYTPVIIVNGKLIPSEYTIDELCFFLNDIIVEDEEIAGFQIEIIN